jgi:2-dehydro-3-deoxyphosphooctonate aldolase (KDO 8-P synthase)
VTEAAPVVTAGSVKFGNALPLAVIAGPCALESRAHAFEMATALKDISARLGIGLVYKTSFDKANRTSGSGARGMGLKQALPILADIRSTSCRSRPSCRGRPILWLRPRAPAGSSM